MIPNLFNLSANDQSVFYLGQIFGYVGGVLPVSQAPLLLGLMFKVINTAALSIGAVMVAYTTVMGLLATASEGEFLGKKWSGLWVPIRTIVGIVGLFPSSGGYCAIQVIIMWLILQGVGLADNLWTAVLQYLDKVGGSPMAAVNFPDISLQVNGAMNALFNGLVCQATYKRTDDVPSQLNNKTYYYCNASQNGSSDPWCQSDTSFADTLTHGKYQYSMGPSWPPACGTLFWCDDRALTPRDVPAYCGYPQAVQCYEDVVANKYVNITGLSSCQAPVAKWCLLALQQSSCFNPDSLLCQECKAQHQALPGIVSTLDAVAQKYAQTDSEYINFYYTSTNQTSQTLTPGGTVSFPGYQGPGTGSFNAPTNAPPEWVQNYCNAGLSTSSGISGASLHCCANGDGCDTNLFNQALPYTSSSSTANDTNYTTPDTTTIQKLYAPYAMGPFLNNQDFIAAATNQYIGALSGAYASYITSLPPQQLTGWEGDASQNGWILAGLYYYKMAKNNENNSVTLGTLPPMQVSPPASTVTSTNYNTNDPKSYPRSNYDPTNTLSEAIQSQAKGGNGAGASMSSGAGNGIPPQMSALTQSISGSVSNLLATFQSDMLGGKTGGAYGRIYAHSLSPGDMVTNPMANMASYGNFLMNLVVGMYAATTAALAIAAFLGGFTFEIAGTGLTANPIYEAFKAVWGMISPFYTLLLCSLFSLGALLSIYVPLIPYMIFTMGAIGWFIATIEAMAAGPFIALGILSAGGQHELLSRAEPSVMIIFNLMLRPSLMVFGMMTSILLAVVVFTMMNQGFSMVVGSILDNPPGPAKSVIFIAAYTSMSVTVMSKVCSPIHVIAEKVLTYIGGQAIQYGEQEALGAMKQAVEGAAGGVEGAGKESAPAAAAGVTAHMTAKAHKAEVAKAAQREEALHAKRNPPKDGGGGAPPVGGGH